MCKEKNQCDEAFCFRPGKLVMQRIESDMGDPFVFRFHMCPWHLGAHNRYYSRMKNFKKLKYIKFIENKIIFRS